MSPIHSSDRLIVKLTLAVIMTMCSLAATGYLLQGSARTNNKANQQRSWELKGKGFPTGVIEITEIKNLNSENFFEDIEIIVKNISDKSIYHIYLLGVATETKAIGLPFHYGAGRLVDIEKQLAKPTDIALPPGQTVALKLDPKIALGYKKAEEQGRFSMTAFSKIKIVSQVVNFGDGTGFLLGDYLTSKGKKISQNIPYAFPGKNSFALNPVNSKKNLQCAAYTLVESNQQCCGIGGCAVNNAVSGGTPKYPCSLGFYCSASVCGEGPAWCFQDYLTDCEGSCL